MERLFELETDRTQIFVCDRCGNEFIEDLFPEVYTLMEMDGGEVVCEGCGH